MRTWILVHALGGALGVQGIFLTKTDAITGLTFGPGAVILFLGLCVCVMAFVGYAYELSKPTPVIIPVKET